MLGFPTIGRYLDSPAPGRFSALTVIGVVRGQHVVVPMAGIWDHLPTLAEACRAGPRRRKKQVLHFAVAPEDPVELSVTDLGTRPLEPSETALLAIYDDDWAPGARVHQTCRVLEQLDRRPRRSELRGEVLDLVTWFNEADDRAGWVIETEEREDVHRVLEDICHAGRHPGVLDEALQAATW